MVSIPMVHGLLPEGRGMLDGHAGSGEAVTAAGRELAAAPHPARLAVTASTAPMRIFRMLSSPALLS
jgi:hypothetical protein